MSCRVIFISKPAAREKRSDHADDDHYTYHDHYSIEKISITKHLTFVSNIISIPGYLISKGGSMQLSESSKGSLGLLGIVAFIALFTWLVGPMFGYYSLTILLGLAICAFAVVVVDPRRQAS
jgi:hypothetical protein